MPIGSLPLDEQELSYGGLHRCSCKLSADRHMLAHLVFPADRTGPCVIIQSESGWQQARELRDSMFLFTPTKLHPSLCLSFFLKRNMAFVV